MSTWITNNFDIELWIKLAADHPFKFEQQRSQWLEHSIKNAAPEWQPRLKGLQWEINMDLEIARNKYRNCNYIGRRLVEHLQTFKDILSGKVQLNLLDKSAEIIEFHRTEV